MYVQAMDGDGTRRRALTGHVRDDGDDDGEDKNNNILVVARAKRACLGSQSIIIIHRARSFIGPPSSRLDQAWHVSVISRSPRCVPSHLPKHSSHHHTSSPSTRNITCLLSLSLLPCPALHYYRPPYYSTCPFCPHRRQLVPTPNPLLALPPSTTPGQRSAFTTTASKPAHHLRPDSFRLPDHRPLLSQPPHRIHRTDLLHRSPATAGPRVPLLPSSISDTLAAACPSLVSFQCCLLHFPFPISALTRVRPGCRLVPAANSLCPRRTSNISSLRRVVCSGFTSHHSCSARASLPSSSYCNVGHVFRPSPPLHAATAAAPSRS
jgi:hypothetical protein